MPDVPMAPVVKGMVGAKRGAGTVGQAAIGRVKAVWTLAWRRPHVVVLPLIVLLLPIGLGCFGVQMAQEASTRTAKSEGSVFADAFSQTLPSALAAMYVPLVQIASLAQLQPDYNTFISSLRRASDAILQATPAGSIITVAPNGRIAVNVPENKLTNGTVGSDLLTGPARSVMLRVMRHKEFSKTGPVVSASPALPGWAILCLPVYIRNCTGTEQWNIPWNATNVPPDLLYHADTSSKWWGLASILADIAQSNLLLRAIQQLNVTGYAVQVLRPGIPGVEGRTAPVLVPEGMPPEDAQVRTLTIGDEEWSVHVWRRDGWQSHWLEYMYILVLLGSLILASMLFAMLLSWEEHRAVLQSLLPKTTIERMRAQARADWATMCQAKSLANSISFETPASNMLQIIAANLADQVASPQLLLAVKEALMRSANVYKPTLAALKDHMEKAEFVDAEVRRALVTQLVGASPSGLLNMGGEQEEEEEQGDDAHEWEQADDMLDAADDAADNDIVYERQASQLAQVCEEEEESSDGMASDAVVFTSSPFQRAKSASAEVMLKLSKACQQRALGDSPLKSKLSFTGKVLTSKPSFQGNQGRLLASRPSMTSRTSNTLHMTSTAAGGQLLFTGTWETEAAAQQRLQAMLLQLMHLPAAPPGTASVRPACPPPALPAQRLSPASAPAALPVMDAVPVMATTLADGPAAVGPVQPSLASLTLAGGDVRCEGAAAEHRSGSAGLRDWGSSSDADWLHPASSRQLAAQEPQGGVGAACVTDPTAAQGAAMDAPPHPIFLQLDRVLMSVDHWAFDVYELDAASNGRPLSVLAYWLLHTSGLSAWARMDPAKLAAFLQAVEAAYPDNPYHNARHAANVLQGMHVILRHGRFKPAYLDKTTLLACYLAALVHDVGHKGRNNDYLVNAHDDLAVRYNDRAPMENHHVALAFSLLKRPELNCLAGLSKANWQKLRKLVIDLVLATDMKAHFATLGQFEAQVQAEQTEHVSVNDVPLTDWLIYSVGGRSDADDVTNSAGNAQQQQQQQQRVHVPALPAGCASPQFSEADRLLTLQMALKVADLGHLTLPLASHLRWVSLLEEELFLQGDAERQQGLPISPLCDRSKGEGVTRSQVGFFEVVALPTLTAFCKRVSTARPLLCAATENFNYWRSREGPKG